MYSLGLTGLRVSLLLSALFSSVLRIPFVMRTSSMAGAKSSFISFDEFKQITREMKSEKTPLTQRTSRIKKTSSTFGPRTHNDVLQEGISVTEIDGSFRFIIMAQHSQPAQPCIDILYMPFSCFSIVRRYHHRPPPPRQTLLFQISS